MRAVWGLSRHTLVVRLSIGFGVVLALVVGMALVGTWALSHTRGLHQQVAAVTQAEQMVQALALEVALDEVRTLAVIRSAGMPEVLTPFAPLMTASAKRVRVQLQAISALDAGLVDRSLLAAAGTAHGSYTRHRDAVVQLVERGQTIQAAAAIQSTLQPAQEAWDRNIVALQQSMHGRTAAARADADRVGRMASQALPLFAVLATLLGVVWARRISSSIARPVWAAVRLSQSIAQGDLRSQAVPHDGLQQEGGEPGQLLQALQTMRDALVAMSGQTAVTATKVAHSSEAMAQSAQNLAIRTEEQTQSVTAAREKVGEVATQIRETARHAEQGHAQCEQLQQAAQSGQAASALAAATMDRVAQRSSDMTEVVTLIESIAFQINLLALNAAVEAARAGEAGTGFAVVAAEVRRLARRSSESAGAIRQLIHGAHAQLQEGVQSVKGLDSALAGMLAMTDEVARATLDIQQATQRQTTALTDAADGLVQLVRVNDANTEMVISTVHGCESLRVEAEQLLARIAQMRLDPAGDTGASAGTAVARAASEVQFF